MHFRIFPALALALLMAGCVTTPEERHAADQAKCRSYGFTKRNDAFAECMQRIDLARQANLRANADFGPWGGPVYSPVVVVRR